MAKAAKGSKAIVAKKGQSAKPQIRGKKVVTAKQAGRKNSRVKNDWTGCFTGINLVTGGWKCEHCDVRNMDGDAACAACETDRRSAGGEECRQGTATGNGATVSANSTPWLPPVPSSIGPEGFNFSSAGGATGAAIGSNGFTIVAPPAPAPAPASAPRGRGGGRRASRCGIDLSRIGAALAQVGGLDWKDVRIVGEQIDNLKTIHAGSGTGEQWDLSTVLGDTVRDIHAADDNARVFLFGSSTPIDFDTDTSSDVHGVRPVPSINAIVIRGEGNDAPPELVAIRDYQRGGEIILPFRAKSLSWQPVGDRVYALTSRLRGCTIKNRTERDIYSYEYASLYTQKPSVDWKLDKHGKLQILHTSFDDSPNGSADMTDDSPITEEFDKEDTTLKAFVPDFLERHDLGEEHRGGVEGAIRDAFVEARKKKQAKIDMLAGNYQDPHVLEDMKVVKIYPRNSFIKDEHKLSYVNEYYGKAIKVV